MSLAERVEIAVLWAAGQSAAQIGRVRGRDWSAIGRELTRDQSGRRPDRRVWRYRGCLPDRRPQTAGRRRDAGRVGRVGRVRGNRGWSMAGALGRSRAVRPRRWSTGRRCACPTKRPSSPFRADPRAAALRAEHTCAPAGRCASPSLRARAEVASKAARGPHCARRPGRRLPNGAARRHHPRHRPGHLLLRPALTLATRLE
ncbi:helix-turn-helix domain-containing protein [Cryptosporangium phraense]|uniref:Helix-turn-helix domain-containing protein n=1 Tax=Cryptosporangium phraense TaxID=2593070 RepID=A0A545AFE1_9ACTN|nr:helix-turn-helix domain-containing protein [Cryptosporangium phraense]